MLIPPFSPMTVYDPALALWRPQSSICGVTRTRVTGVVTSYSSIVLAGANWHKGNLHQRITNVNIDFPSSGNHSLACKKVYVAILNHTITVTVSKYHNFMSCSYAHMYQLIYIYIYMCVRVYIYIYIIYVYGQGDIKQGYHMIVMASQITGNWSG